MRKPWAVFLAAVVVAAFFLLLEGCEGGSPEDDGDAQDSRDTTEQAGEDGSPDAPSDHAGDADVPHEGEAGGEGEDVVVENPRALLDAADACLAAGCRVTGSQGCCEGLTPAADCLPGDECAPDAQFCIRCGDSVCGAHENVMNCPGDCLQQCVAGGVATVPCSGAAAACTCVQPGCIPKCLFTGTQREGWYYSCEGGERLVTYAACGGESAECGAIGSFSEGWYEAGSGELIEWQYCHNTWICE